MNAVFILSGLGIFSLLAEIVNIKKTLFIVVLTGLAAAILVSLNGWNTPSSYYNDMLFFDHSAIAFSVVLAAIVFLWLLFSKNYIEETGHVTEHFALILFCLTGAVFMVSYHNMVMLFLGIETLSISLYILAGSRMKDILSNEAAFKYFIMGAFATGFLLFGIALIYGATGSFHLEAIRNVIASGDFAFSGLLYTGIAMILIGLAFKVSAAPFHFWTPDVYQGSPTLVTAFMSTIVKIAAFASFFRLFSVCFASVTPKWVSIIEALTILTLVISNVTAVYQQNVKRLLAYSSIAHAGYLLITLITINTTSTSVILYYLSAYAVATLGTFAVLYSITKDNGQETIDSFRGLAKSQPFLVLIMTLSLLSLAGIPPLPGFFAKYMIFSLALQNGYTWLVLLAIGTSLVGVYYYFRIVIAMFSSGDQATTISMTLSQKVMITILVVLNITLGLLPGWLISLV